VFSNGGEKIIDSQSTAPVNTDQQPGERLLFPVDSAGMVIFPLIGKVKISGMLIPEAEQSLRTAYATFYKDPFVKLNFANKRVVVLGSFGNKVIPLQNENMRLTEVLALTGATENLGKVDKIRILRGEGYFIADLSTLQNFAKNDVTIEPNDIIYVEPTSKKPIREAIRDYGPLASFLTAITTLIVLIQTN
jgi:polysaccharide export outer membrane protein